MAFENDDWTKVGTWDLYCGDTKGYPTLIVRIKDLRHYLLGFDSGTPTDRERLTKFMALPSARPMPARLRREVDRFLASGRDNLPG